MLDKDINKRINSSGIVASLKKIKNSNKKPK